MMKSPNDSFLRTSPSILYMTLCVCVCCTHIYVCVLISDPQKL